MSGHKSFARRLVSHGKARLRIRANTVQANHVHTRGSDYNLNNRLFFRSEVRDRNRAVKSIGKYLEKNLLLSEEFPALWKGLFMCYWLSDKVKVQHELARRIGRLVHSITLTETCFAFVTHFWEMLIREWTKIDYLR
jgi:hypothetical protein